MAKSAQEVQQDIQKRFEDTIKDTIKEGSVIDMYNSAISEEIGDIYDEIEKNKTPHIWSNLEGETLDWTGAWTNLPRKIGESDTNYRYRLKHWTKSNEASNTIAIQNAIMTMQYASNVDYQPYTHGSGTGTCYIIPKEYTADTIMKALEETKDAVKQAASPSLYVEYIIPTVRSVKFEIYIQSEDGDLDVIKHSLETDIAQYVNTIPPKDYLSVGDINRMGINEPFVDYFSVVSLLIDNNPVATTRVLQTIDTKLLFDEIIWIEGVK